MERESIGSFDEDWALLLDRWLRRLSKREGLCRLVMGRLAHPLLERKSYRRLGFARVGDYARERLGISARELQSLASVATRLHALPATEAALIRGELSWSKVRLLAGTATAESEQEWIARAQAMTVRALQARITSESQAATPANSAQGAAADCDGSSIDVASGCVVGVVAGADANVAAGLVTDTGDGSAADPVSGSTLHAACDLPAAVAGGSSVDTPASTTTGAFVGNSWNEGAAGDLPAVSGTAPQAAMQAAVDTDEDHCIDGEEPAEVRIACPRYVRSAWRMAVELASRMSGTPLPQWRAAEAVAAEALAGAPAGSRACLDGSEERDTEEGTPRLPRSRRRHSLGLSGTPSPKGFPTSWSCLQPAPRISIPSRSTCGSAGRKGRCSAWTFKSDGCCARSPTGACTRRWDFAHWRATYASGSAFPRARHPC